VRVTFTEFTGQSVCLYAWNSSRISGQFLWNFILGAFRESIVIPVRFLFRCRQFYWLFSWSSAYIYVWMSIRNLSAYLLVCIGEKHVFNRVIERNETVLCPLHFSVSLQFSRSLNKRDAMHAFLNLHTQQSTMYSWTQSQWKIKIKLWSPRM
jgi:hypothetical protein